MTRWTADDLDRVAKRLKQSIALPLQQPQGWQKVDHRVRKYRNKPVVYEGRRFASGLEKNRYVALKLIEAAGEITDLRWQTKWDLRVNGFHVGYYVSDFDYLENGRRVVEDTKGFPTPVYKLKKKMLKAQYGYDIREITA